jgi:hypothetical protein
MRGKRTIPSRAGCSCGAVFYPAGDRKTSRICAFDEGKGELNIFGGFGNGFATEF